MIYSNIRLNLGMTAAPDHYHKVYNNNMYLRFGYSDITSGTHTRRQVMFIATQSRNTHNRESDGHNTIEFGNVFLYRYSYPISCYAYKEHCKLVTIQ